MSRAKIPLSSSISEPFLVKIRIGSTVVSLRIAVDSEPGGYNVSSPTLRGLNTQGDSIEEAVENGREAAMALLTEHKTRRNG